MDWLSRVFKDNCSSKMRYPAAVSILGGSWLELHELPSADLHISLQTRWSICKVVQFVLNLVVSKLQRSWRETSTR
jgi:hypothetical protein